MPIRVVVIDPRPLVREALASLLAGDPEFEVCPPASSMDGLFLHGGDGNIAVVLVGLSAVREIEESALIQGTGYGRSLRVLVLGGEHTEETICRLLMLGCCGYLAENASVATLKKAIHAVARGEIWAERRLVARTFHQALAAAGADAVLTSREREILGLVREGRTNRQIAETLYISPETVKWHLRRVFSKIGARDRLEATLYARERNIFPRLDRQAPAPVRRD